MDNNQLMIQIAKYYYDQNLTYAEIGEIIHVSRFTVSRLLQKAKDIGIVEIKIHDQFEREESLERKLLEQYPLKDAIVMKRMERPEKDLREGLGYLASRYLDEKLKSGWTLGVSWGRTLDSLIRQLEPSRKKEIKVVQMMGHAGLANPKIDGPDLVRRLAEKYNGEYVYLPAPLIVEDVKLKEDLVKQPRIKSIIGIASSANILVFGIGSLVMEDYSVWSGYLSGEEITNIKKNGAVGHICGQFFDKNGRMLDIDINKRFIGMSLDKVNEVNMVICVAGGSEKPVAIMGGLRGNLFNVLITDDVTVQAFI